ncbi:MAG: hypothetical protein A2507_00375 [Candidatus Magasanikbacteria bacterium RIFOXYD12_FULL_33_17]|nr:MAG: hypothetical protein A2507_00375 [Candidatus Magasanikbacteria bacterium RIFOXYD12_FULL_33_17]
MSQISKIILTIIITAILSGSLVYLLQQKQSPSLPPTSQEETSSDEWSKIVKYNCEQSGGEFTNNKCECPFEDQLEQTSESMYDKSTGQCQTTIGGPGGELGQIMNQHIGLRLELDECKKK